MSALPAARSPAAPRSAALSDPSRAVRRVSRAVLAVLLLALLAGATTFSRAGWPGLVGDEATYLMQAESVAFDLDLVYRRADYDRFIARHGQPPEGLILQRAGDGPPVFGKPALYALWIAPFVRWMPTAGAPVANALLLALAAALAARTLERRIGAAAAVWVAAWCFASVAFAYVFWAHADAFLLACAALGLALAYRGEPTAVAPGALPDLYEPPGGLAETASPWRPLVRWAAAGALLAVPGAFRPFYLALLVPAAVAAWAEAPATPGARRWARPAALLAGAAALVALSAGLQLAAGGAWTAYGGERQGFYVRTGFPEVDFPSAAWDDSVRRWGNTSWLFEGALGDFAARSDAASLWGWNALYFLAGRNIGVLPYFLPLVLALGALSTRRGRWLLPLAVLVAMAGFFLVRPFNFYGGGGAIGDRYFLPLYPALWFLAGRPSSGPAGDRRRLGGAVAVAALAAPFLLPLWTAPRAFPIGEDGRYRHAGAAARRLLPYETTQSHVPGGRDVSMNGLWIKTLDGPVEQVGTSGLRATAPGRVALLVGSPRPIGGLRLSFGPGGPGRIELAGAELAGTLLSAGGGVTFLLALGEPRAVHPMWWSEDPWHLYQVAFAPAGDGASAGAPGAFTLEPAEGTVEELLR